MLLLLAGVAVGYVSTLADRAERAVQRATEIEAASRERDRLARGIHDSVLQVLALVQRRGAEVGGEAAEIGRLAGEQEAALRALIAADERRLRPASGEPGPAGSAHPGSVRLGVDGHARRAGSATGAWAREVTAAVRRRSTTCTAIAAGRRRAWVLVDDEGEAVTVTIRDDGPGSRPVASPLAAADGRLGISQAICGRMRDLGGSAHVTSHARDGHGGQAAAAAPTGGSR